MASRKQKIQQVLSWKLRLVMGARSNLYPRERELPENIRRQLWLINSHLNNLEGDIVSALRNIP